jgi:hypothetical protein
MRTDNSATIIFEVGKDKAAQALAAKRWKKTTPEERTEVAQNMNASRWADKTPEERAATGAKSFGRGSPRW